jgi:hypothetical protein
MNALEQIAGAVTPAVMVSACGLIALGLDNQISRMANRLRELVREHRSPGAAADRRTALAAQVAILDRRHALYYRALILNYSALLAFVLTSVLWLGRGLLPIPAGLPVLVFTLGVLMLAGMAVFVIASIHLARSTIQSEAAEVLHPGGGGGTGEPERTGGRG